ncbi:MAG: hypothetical protein D6725_07300 [Planctomycetota bacterium]|nr:MAG: hypothetical protein D6725_07300 [Planctomycetota bacterium]
MVVRASGGRRGAGSTAFRDQAYEVGGGDDAQQAPLIVQDEHAVHGFFVHFLRDVLQGRVGSD